MCPTIFFNNLIYTLFKLDMGGSKVKRDLQEYDGCICKYNIVHNQGFKIPGYEGPT